MAEIFRRIDRLALRAQHDVRDHFLLAAFAGELQDLIELAGRTAPFGESVIESSQDNRGWRRAFRVGRVMHAIYLRCPAFLQHLRRRDVGEDHELLDQAMRVKRSRRIDARDRAVGIKDDLALGQIEIERRAF